MYILYTLLKFNTILLDSHYLEVGEYKKPPRSGVNQNRGGQHKINLPAMIQLKSPNLWARAIAPVVQVMNSIAFGKTISEAKPMTKINLADNFEKQATVEEEIRPHSVGRIHFQATSWPARCQQEVILVPGQTVRVVGIDNITQLVEPLE